MTTIATDAQQAQQNRAVALRAFATLLGLPVLAGLRQRGRDPENARFTLDLADGRSIRIGTIRVLWSQAELAKVLAVTLGILPPDIERRDWRNAIAALITHGLDVDEAPGETFEDAVREWAKTYARYATTDRDGAARQGSAFHDAEYLYITASGFATYIRREYSEQVKLTELRQALADIGATRDHVTYDKNPGATGRSRQRTSASYYRLAFADLEVGDHA